MNLEKIFSFLILVFSSVILYGQNYDEAKVPVYKLPDPLILDSKVVKTAKVWEKFRRPEILKLFEENVYGTMPKRFDSISFKIVRNQPNVMDGKARLKEVVVEVFNNRKSLKINVVLFVPKSPVKPAPVLLLINNRSKRNTDPDRVVKSEFWPAEMLIDSGYAAAAFHISDLAPDNKNTFATKLLELYPEELSRNNGMRAIGAWAFGASRVMDYLEKDKDIDASRVAIAGHSRGGKASLWAAAQDKRFAMCFSNCSGNTGAALARRQYGERITYINTTFPHWFNDNYKKYNDNEDLLPVDQHMLISLVAPRSVYLTNASEDLWADPKGTYLALKNAENVYNLYTKQISLPVDPPPLDSPVIKGPLGYHNRTGKHDMNLSDWRWFLNFANRQLTTH